MIFHTAFRMVVVGYLCLDIFSFPTVCYGKRKNNGYPPFTPTPP